MEKTVIILDGISTGKTKFVEIAKQSGFWVWNINHRNVLSMLAHKVGWNEERDQNFYSFIDDFVQIANKYFDFENWYVDSSINRFDYKEGVDLVIIHNCSKETGQRLQTQYPNCYSILIVDDDQKPVECEYCKTINYKDENYPQLVLETLNIMTNRTDNARE